MDDTHIASMKIVQFLRPPSPLSIYVQIFPPLRPWTYNFKQIPPLQMITNQLKENII